jgi:hypothetical protein
MDAVRKEIGSSIEDVAAVVDRITLQIESTGSILDQKSVLIQNQAKQSVNAIHNVIQQTQKEALTLKEITQEIEYSARNATESINTSTINLVAKSEEKLSDLVLVSDKISIRVNEIDNNMQSVIQNAELYRGELRAQAKLIADSSSETADQIGQAITMMAGSMDDISYASLEISAKISKARENLADESDRLLHVSSAALESSKDAANTFARQSESLFKTTQDITKAAQAMEEQHHKAQRTSFMSSIKFVIESLHSLSIDISRLMEGGVIPEKIWKAYKDGDTAIFTRHLASLSEHVPIEKAREKFEKDNEFRTYTQRFIRQYEEIYDQAKINDHGAMLTTMIASSDIAKLYQQLCQISGKTAKT